MRTVNASGDNCGIFVPSGASEKSLTWKNETFAELNVTQDLVAF